MRHGNIKADVEREKIVFGESIDWEESSGGVVRFRRLEAETGEQLIDDGYLNPEERQNYAPSAGEIVAFALEHGGFVDGYMVHPERPDARISLVGLAIPSKHCDVGTVAAFANRFRHADEFTADAEHGCSAWFD